MKTRLRMHRPGSSRVPEGSAFPKGLRNAAWCGFEPRRELVEDRDAQADRMRFRLLCCLLLAGCGAAGTQSGDPDASVSDPNPDDTRAGLHDVTAKWHLRQLDGTLMAACPPGFTDIFVHLYKGPSYVEPPDALVRTPCTPEGSLTQPVATEGRLLDPNTSGENKAYFD